jgi:hypothetical protein
MKKFKRNCPKCGKIIKHTIESNCKQAQKQKCLCVDCSHKLLANRFAGKGNPFYHKKHTQYSKELISAKRIGQHNSLKTEFKKGRSGYNSTNIPKNNLNALLRKTAQSFYWLGFILADGSFSNDGFEITLANKDKEHLEKFAQFINFKNKFNSNKKTNSTRMGFKNKKAIREFRRRYDLHLRKTYNPPSFSKYKKYHKFLLTSLLIGMIDGDGCISKNGSKNARSIVITLHPNWSLFYKCLLTKIGINYHYHYYGKKRNISIMGIYSQIEQKKLYKTIKKYKIFVLNRKWIKIKEIYE